MTGHARFRGIECRDPVEVRPDLNGVTSGFWAVVVTFEGEITAIRFASVRRSANAGQAPTGVPWRPLAGTWSTSIDEATYVAGVRRIRDDVAAGRVYQVNLCRILQHGLDEDADLDGLEALLAAGNPAPYPARIHVPDSGLDVVSASPEAYLTRVGGRLVSRPIKGTAPTAAAMLPKDVAENVMIADLVRNDLQRVCRPGSVDVEALCAPEPHPGLVHLVTDVAGVVAEDVSWPEILAATFPPGSVSGAPKSTALEVIAELEPTPRGPYCGAIGWIDGDTGTAELAVGIRTFWSVMEDGQRRLRFGAGAGITWGSDPDAEWRETELKADRLVGIASGRVSV